MPRSLFKNDLNFGLPPARAVIDFVYPPVCALCQTALPIADEKRLLPSLCPECVGVILSDTRDACQRCGNPIGPFLDPTVPCFECRRRRLAFGRLIRLGVYEGRLRHACIRAKSFGTQPLAAALANQLWTMQCAAFRTCAIDVVVPVPQYWLHRLWKPHNPPETIGQILARQLKVPCDTRILAKIRRTPDQSSLPSRERRTNLRGAFRVQCISAVSGRNVLLVDDIRTTGTTANEASRTLKKQGAKSVTVAVLAVVTKGG